MGLKSGRDVNRRAFKLAWQGKQHQEIIELQTEEVQLQRESLEHRRPTGYRHTDRIPQLGRVDNACSNWVKDGPDPNSTLAMGGSLCDVIRSRMIPGIGSSEADLGVRVIFDHMDRASSGAAVRRTDARAGERHLVHSERRGVWSNQG